VNRLERDLPRPKRTKPSRRIIKVVQVQPLTVLSIAGSTLAEGRNSGRPSHLLRLRSARDDRTHGRDRPKHPRRGSVLNVAPAMVSAQVRSVVADFDVCAVKTGMLAQPATVEQVAELASEGLLPHLVVDPVLVSSSGHPLMDTGGVDAYRDALLEHAEVVTPNLRERRCSAASTSMT